MYRIEKSKKGKYLLDMKQGRKFCVLDRSQDIEKFDPDIFWEGEKVRTIIDKRGQEVDIVRLIKPVMEQVYETHLKVLDIDTYQKGYIIERPKSVSIFSTRGKVIQTHMEPIPECIKPFIRKFWDICEEEELIHTYRDTGTLWSALREAVKKRIQFYNLEQTRHFDEEEEAKKYAEKIGSKYRVTYWEEEFYGEQVIHKAFVVEDGKYKEKIERLKELLEKLEEIEKEEE